VLRDLGKLNKNSKSERKVSPEINFSLGFVFLGFL